MRENKKSILLAVISGIVACIVCAGVIFTFPTNKSNLKGNESTLPNNEEKEIKLGDEITSCATTEEYCDEGDSNHYSDSHSCMHRVSDAVDDQCADGLYNYMGVCYDIYTKHTRCTSCGTGSYLLGDSCFSCPPGSYCQNSVKVICEAGTYSSENGASACTPCSGEKEWSAAGATQCATCDGDGNQANLEHTGCVNPTSSGCSAGYWRGQNGCEICPAGSYCPDGIRKIACSGNKINNEDGLTACNDTCSPGEEPNAAHTECVACVGNKISTNGSECVACPSGQISNQSNTACYTPQSYCYCNPTSGMCEWRYSNVNNWELMSSIHSQEQCNAYSSATSAGCFQKNNNTYEWGSYGNSAGYTMVPGITTSDSCEALNSGDPVGATYALSCPSGIIMLGETIACTYSTSGTATLANYSITGVGTATGSIDGKYLNITAPSGATVGGITVYGITSDGNRTNSVSLIISDSSIPSTCQISISTGSVSTSVSSETNDINSYYTVNVNVKGADCGGQKITYTATNSKNNPPAAEYTILDGHTSYTTSFKVYTKTSCSASTTTATLTNKNSSKVTISESQVKTDWKSTDGHCETSPAYTSFEAADRVGANVYYTNYGACENDAGNGYRTKWTRGGCGSSGSYSFCCVKNDGSGQSWLTGQSSKKCPEGYTLDSTKNSNTCLKTFACYKDSDNNTYWTSEPQPSWVVVSKPELECKDQEACFEDPTGQRFWGKYYDQITNGYILITSIKDEDTCTNPSDSDACYINNSDITDYRWSKLPIDGYTKVEGVTDAKECQPEACYIEKEKNEFTFGKYKDNDNYIPVYKTIEVDGEYIDVLITDKKECTNEVPVPPTDFDVAKLVYVFMAILMACGIAFIYYSTVAKKQNQ